PVRLKLLVASGPDFARELVLDRGTYRIGKDPSNDLALSDPAVSRTHLLVEVLANTVRITDNNSTNGAFFEGLRFTAMEARPGSVIRIGRTELKLVPQGVRAPTMPPAERDRFGGLVGASLRMREVFAMLEKIASS